MVLIREWYCWFYKGGSLAFAGSLRFAEEALPLTTDLLRSSNSAKAAGSPASLSLILASGSFWSSPELSIGSSTLSSFRGVREWTILLEDILSELFAE